MYKVIDKYYILVNNLINILSALLGNIQVLCGCLDIREKFRQVEIWVRKNETHEEIIFYFAETRKGK